MSVARLDKWGKAGVFVEVSPRLGGSPQGNPPRLGKPSPLPTNFATLTPRGPLPLNDCLAPLGRNDAHHP